jgi:hypothetical protein
MRAPAKWKTWCAVATACLFFLQSCATIVRGTSQKIPVTSNPAGARIIADGKDMGLTPLSLKLAQKRDHLVRVEKEGYVPLEIRVLSRGAGNRALFVLGNVIWGIMAALPGAAISTKGLLGAMFGEENAEDKMKGGELLMLLGFVGGWFGSVALDSSSGATRSLRPEYLRVTLNKPEEGTPPSIEVITLKDWQNIRWIRIGCAGSNADAGTIFIK